MPFSELAIQANVRIYTYDNPQHRIASFEFEFLWQLVEFLRLEGYVQISAGGHHVLDRLRIKLSYFEGTEHRCRFVPYLLFHYGSSYFLRLFEQRLSVFMLGIEFDV